MKTILIVLLVVIGLYSCEKEPTSAIQYSDLNGKWFAIDSVNSLDIVNDSLYYLLKDNNISFYQGDSLFYKTTYELFTLNYKTIFIINKYPLPSVITNSDGTFTYIYQDYKYYFEITKDSMMSLTLFSRGVNNFKPESPQFYVRI